jgi:soluble lytic murein transglycosylase-like protein
VTEDVLSCMARVAEIQKRFGLSAPRDRAQVPADDSAKKQSFADILSDAAHGDKKTAKAYSRDEIDALVERVSRAEGVSASLVKAVIENESSYNSRAVSPKGAQGLMQLMPDTAASLGVDDSFDAEKNVRGGVRYLRELLGKYQGDYSKALAAYNAGPKNVDAYQGIPPFAETRKYVRDVMEDYNRISSGDNTEE